MKKIFTICLAGALTLAAACSDKKEGETTTLGTITVSGIIEKVSSAFYGYEPADRFDEGAWTVILCRDNYTSVPASEPDFYIGVLVSDSCLDKEIPLTEPLTAGGKLTPAINVALHGRMVEIDDESIDVYLNDGETLAEITVTEGRLKVTRDGDNFTVKLSVEFSDGVSASANWSGTATQAEIE